MTNDPEYINWNDYSLGFDARLRGDPYDPGKGEDWRLGWKDCDVEINLGTVSGADSEGGC